MTSLPFSLAKGYRQFRVNNFALNRKHFDQLAESGQNPEVMIVSCCDSRVAPEVEDVLMRAMKELLQDGTGGLTSGSH